MFDIIFSKDSNIKNDVFLGIMVVLVLVLEVVVFVFVVGVELMIGLYVVFMMGLIMFVIGGCFGMIFGVIGVMVVVMVLLVSEYGVQYLFVVVVLVGLLQIFCGVFCLGKFICLVLYLVMLGFVNGLVIVIFLVQFGQFKVVDVLGE